MVDFKMAAAMCSVLLIFGCTTPPTSGEMVGVYSSQLHPGSKLTLESNGTFDITNYAESPAKVLKSGMWALEGDHRLALTYGTSRDMWNFTGRKPRIRFIQPSEGEDHYYMKDP